MVGFVRGDVYKRWRERGWGRARADGMKVMSRKNRFIRVGSRALFSARRGAEPGRRRRRAEKRGKKEEEGSVAWKWRNRPVKNFERMCIRVLYAFQFRRADRDGGRGPGSTSSDWLQRTSFETTLGANLHADVHLVHLVRDR